MIYYTLKVILNIFYRVFYRLGYRNIQNIPDDKPVIFAPNHTNAFIDPTISCMLVSRKVRFFARGDVFKGRVARYFLDKMNISPMYRMEEGFSEVKKNDKTFEECKRLLTENKCILIFPEGICVQERRLRKLRKGLARILFMTEEESGFSKDVVVIPVGINYKNASKIRSKVFIDFGEPISAKDHFEKFRTDKIRTINEFTQVLEEKMSETMLVVEDPINDPLMLGLEEMFLEPMMKQRKYDKDDMEKEYLLTKEIAGTINKLQKEDQETAKSLREKVDSYSKSVHEKKLRDHLLREDSIEALTMLSFIRDFLIAWFCTPIFWIGMIMNNPPYYLAKKIADKKVKNIEFHASMNANIAWVFWFFWYSIQLLVVALVFRSWPLLGIYALLVPVLLWFCISYYPRMKKIFGRWRLMRMVRKQKPMVEKLMNQRYEIVQIFEKLMSGS